METIIAAIIGAIATIGGVLLQHHLSKDKKGEIRNSSKMDIPKTPTISTHTYTPSPTSTSTPKYPPPQMGDLGNQQVTKRQGKTARKTAGCLVGIVLVVISYWISTDITQGIYSPLYDPTNSWLGFILFFIGFIFAFFVYAIIGGD